MNAPQMYHWSGPSRTVDLRPVHVERRPGPDHRLRTVAAGFVAGCVASVGAAGWLLPIAWAERGYAAAGGEWAVIIGAGALVGVGFAWWIERHECGR
jgi:ferric-dicitrate binding protein FerR (iron transport regulator)